MVKSEKSLAQKMREELRYLSILDFGDGKIIVERVPKAWDTEMVELYLFETLGFKESAIDWMLSECLDIEMR
jgi:hypothetical protein